MTFLKKSPLLRNGSVSCSNHAALPKFDAGFVGSVSVSGTTYDFVVDAKSSPAVSGAILAPNGRISIPSASVMRIDFPTKAKGGHYVLVSAANIEGATDLRLEITGLTRDLEMHLTVTETEIALDVIPWGAMLIVR